MEEAVAVLTESPWAHKETYTSVLGGIGSGIAGEKEIYNTFFVRLLSARPIREAYARMGQLQANYDGMNRDQKRQLDRSLEPGLKLDVSRWIIITLSFRSNIPSEELRVRNFFSGQTTESMRNRVRLSTKQYQQLELEAYFPPLEDAVGAKFVFPRRVQGESVLMPEGDNLAFEVDIPGFEPDLRVNFDAGRMALKGTSVF
jgi:hypothetical protein